MISNSGVSKEPIRSTILFGLMHKYNTIIKYISVNINKARLPLLCAIGVTVISNDVDAVRGIANKGPIVK